MITHFDMITGKVIEDDDKISPADRAPHSGEKASLRLLAVHEATNIAPRRTTSPGVVVGTLSINRLLATLHIA